MKTLTLKYDLAVSLMAILQAVKLAGVRNIQRGRALRLLKDETELFDAERQRMLKEEHAELDEDGELKEQNGGVVLKSRTSWEEAIKKLIKEAPIKIQVATDADRGWIKLVHEVMTTKLCPELTGEPAMNFDEILEAVNAAIEEPKVEEAE